MKIYIAKIIGAFINIISYLSIKLSSSIALELFSKPLKGRFKSKNLFLESSKKEFLYHNGLKIATYHWSGPKETILLAHGWQSNSGRWKNLILRLAKLGYNIVSLDGPGHGCSGNKSFNAILYSKFIGVVCGQYNPSILIGHSVGGMAISYFLHKSQYKKINKFIFLGSPSGFTNILNNYIILMQYNNRVRKGLEHRIQDRFKLPSSHFNTANFINKIDCRGLIIHDKTDPIIPYSDALEIFSAHKKSQLYTTEGLGHGLKSKKVTEKIIEFIQD